MNSADNVVESLREELEREQTYRLACLVYTTPGGTLSVYSAYADNCLDIGLQLT